METPAQQYERLMRSTEELVDLEGLYLRAGYYDLVVEVRDRLAPLVQRLSELIVDTADTTQRARFESVIRRSQDHAALLKEKMEDLRRELGELAQARQRTGQVLPAYGRRSQWVLPRFVAAG